MSNYARALEAGKAVERLSSWTSKRNLWKLIRELLRSQARLALALDLAEARLEKRGD